MTETPIQLWHYCCDHSARGIRATRIVRPIWQPLLHLELSWWTDLTPPDRLGLGLTSQILSCDRIAHRFHPTTASRGLVEPWLTWLQRQPATLRQLGRELHLPGTLPRHWHVAERPVHVQAGTTS
ncbi:hypothetical protein ACFFKU_06955 [Kineococcus gynurae]|uniref:Uncharacterized protein n=1 Tax=Kineococcus gynurae TaxID=452979 RepID=A0ABV5LX08_9ACTN